jgi:hypothetical protein
MQTKLATSTITLPLDRRVRRRGENRVLMNNQTDFCGINSEKISAGGSN